MSEPPKRVWLSPDVAISGGFGDPALIDRDDCEYILAADHARLVEALAVAREALRPFAEFPAASDTRLPPGMTMTLRSKFAAKQVIVADFWRAAVALARIDALQKPDETLQG